MADDIKLNIKPLEHLINSFRGKLPIVRVGILGDTARNKGKSNAEVGAAHEFGTSKLPIRSFLRMPLTDYLNKYLDDSGAFDKNSLNKVVKNGSLIPWMEKVAVVAENVVMDAFDTKGFGKWPSWKNPNYMNNTGQVLVDTQQLRNSITSEVV
jgi:phage gpG-like protein